MKNYMERLVIFELLFNLLINKVNEVPKLLLVFIF